MRSLPVCRFVACRVFWRAVAWRGLWVVLGGALLAASSARAQPASNQCGQELAQADSLYQNGAFSASAQQARQCLQGGTVSLEEQKAAFRLFALANLRQGNQEAARRTVSGLLRAVPGYRPDPVQDPPSYVTLVTDVRQRLQAAGQLPEPPGPPRPPWYERRGTWLAIGGGLVAVGLVAIFGGG